LSQVVTMVSKEGLTKNSIKETQHQTPSKPNLGAPRSFFLSFSQTPPCSLAFAYTLQITLIHEQACIQDVLEWMEPWFIESKSLPYFKVQE